MTTPAGGRSVPSAVVHPHAGPPADPHQAAAWPRRPRRAGLALAIVLVFAVAGVIGTFVTTRAAIERVERVPGVADALSGPSGSVENFLLVGSDTRAGADPDAPDFGGIGTEDDVSGTRSDTIMLLRRDTATGEAALLSIPRDLWVAIPGHGSDRVNSAYRHGPEVLVRTVQESLGLPVHHYVEIDFVGFKRLVDAIGGVELCFWFPVRDVHTGLYVPEGGCYVVDGVTALAYARSRYFEQWIDDEWVVDGSADLGRMKRQQDFVNRALAGALAEVRANPFRAGDMFDAGSTAVRIDDELDLLDAAASLRAAVDGGLDTWSLPVRGDTIDGKSVLQLAGGASEVLAWFAGEGPRPPGPT